ncbi:hypothetical protein TNCV_1850361 [Trichonephila clavipes]|nr:hypothetical protein TNCV_1850361 [Trichonephila clavipes]
MSRPELTTILPHHQQASVIELLLCDGSSSMSRPEPTTILPHHQLASVIRLLCDDSRPCLGLNLPPYHITINCEH